MITQEWLDEINRVREVHEAAPLTWSEECFDFAEKNVSIVAASRRDRLWHPGNGGAEIAALGQETIQEACKSWLHSPGHRVIMLGLIYTEVGIAMKVNRFGKMVWMAQFK